MVTKLGLFEKEYERFKKIKIERTHDEDVFFRDNFNSMRDNFNNFFETAEGERLLNNIPFTPNIIIAVSYINDCFEKKQKIEIEANHVKEFNFFIRQCDLKSYDLKFYEIIQFK